MIQLTIQSCIIQRQFFVSGARIAMEPLVTALLTEAAQRADRYLAGLDSRPVFPAQADVDRLDQMLAAPLPDEPAGDAQVLRFIDELGSPATAATAGSRYFGLVIGGALPASLAASWLTAAWDQNAGMYMCSPAAAAFEAAALRDLLDLLGLPSESEGAFVGGATMASFTALLAARHALLAREGWDVEARGLFRAPEIPVFASADIHPSLRKGLGMLGLGRERVVALPVDDQGRIREDGLSAIDRPGIVCAQSGNVNTGASDPFEALALAAARTGSWLHVDGAFGLWAAAAPRRRHLVRGIEHASSWATDGHKWLNAPYDSGIAFVRDAAALRAACSLTAAYLAPASHRDPCATTPGMSGRARGVEVWAALRALGRSGVADLVERTCRHAARFAEGLADAGFEILNDVVLNQVLVSFGTEAETARARDAIQRDGTCWCGGTLFQGRRAMRISVSSWATTDADVELSLKAMLRCAKE
jgi:glutamate/tyrosine decarboxylase-like PLP-dependent enzyme